MTMLKNKVIGLEAEKKVVHMALKHNFPVLIEGETGQGKTYLLTSVAEELGQRIVRFSVNKNTGIEELVGRWHIREGAQGASVTEWVDGALVRAMRDGDIFLLDEQNIAPAEVLTCAYAVMDSGRLMLAEKDGEVVKAHPCFRLVATQNPSDEYAGTREVSKALLSRFPVVINIPPYAPAEEKEIVMYQGGVDDATARVMVDVGNGIRKARTEDRITYVCSTRDLVSWARVLMADGLTLGEAFSFSILNKAPKEEREVIRKACAEVCKIEIPWNEKRNAGRALTASLAKTAEKLEAERKLIEERLKAIEAISSMTRAECTAEVTGSKEGGKS